MESYFGGSDAIIAVTGGGYESFLGGLIVEDSSDSEYEDSNKYKNDSTAITESKLSTNVDQDPDSEDSEKDIPDAGYGNDDDLQNAPVHSDSDSTSSSDSSDSDSSDSDSSDSDSDTDKPIVDESFDSLEELRKQPAECPDDVHVSASKCADDMENFGHTHGGGKKKKPRVSRVKSKSKPDKSKHTKSKSPAPENNTSLESSPFTEDEPDEDKDEDNTLLESSPFTEDKDEPDEDNTPLESSPFTKDEHDEHDEHDEDNTPLESSPFTKDEPDEHDESEELADVFGSDKLPDVSDIVDNENIPQTKKRKDNLLNEDLPDAFSPLTQPDEEVDEEPDEEVDEEPDEEVDVVGGSEVFGSALSTYLGGNVL
jgi:hypothetical protein